MSEIKFPPVPDGWTDSKPWDYSCPMYTEGQLRAYARAAIEQDRQSQGEPVGYIYGNEFNRFVSEDAFGKLGKISQQSIKLNGKRVYSAPQPAEPVKSSIKVSYDEKGDCLYVTVDSNEPATANEDERGIIHRYAVSDGRLVGITIAGLMGDYRKAAEPINDPKTAIKPTMEDKRLPAGESMRRNQGMPGGDV